MNRENLKHKVFMEVAEVISQLSHDKHSKFGCVIVDEDDHIVSTGFNGLPRGWDDNDDFFLERPEKYNWMCHSETNSIYNSGRNLKGCRAYVSGVPCLGCLIALWNSRVETIYHTGKLANMIDNEEYQKRLKTFREKLEPKGLRLIDLDSIQEEESDPEEEILWHITKIMGSIGKYSPINDSDKNYFLKDFNNWGLQKKFGETYKTGDGIEFIHDTKYYDGDYNSFFRIKNLSKMTEYHFILYCVDDELYIEDIEVINLSEKFSTEGWLSLPYYCPNEDNLRSILESIATNYDHIKVNPNALRKGWEGEPKFDGTGESLYNVLYRITDRARNKYNHFRVRACDFSKLGVAIDTDERTYCIYVLDSDYMKISLRLYEDGTVSNVGTEQRY